MRIALVLALFACTVADHAQLPPPMPGALSLSVAPLTPGVASIHSVSGAQPGSWVYLGASARPPSPGPCLPSAGGLCLDLASPTLLGTVRADAAGEAHFLLVTPVSLTPGLAVTMQAVAIQGPGGRDSASSAAITAILDGDGDGDGFPASEDCDDGDAEVFPGAAEVCNGLDDDCDPLTTEEGGITVNGVAFGSLSSAISGAPTGAEIHLCGGTHLLNEVHLQRPVSFIGDGPERAVIRPSNERILRATADFTARHVTFTGGRGTLIGRHALRLECDGVCYDHMFDDVVFEGNANGALYAITESLTITDSVFRNNVGGGALHTGRGDIRVERTVFEDNVNTWAGGGIRVEGGTVTLVDATLYRNDAPGGGGAAVDASLHSVRTDWGFGPNVDNTPDDVKVYLSIPGGGANEYTFFGADESFSCHGSSLLGPLGCQ